MGELVDGFGPGGKLARPMGPHITERKYVPTSVSARRADAEV